MADELVVETRLNPTAVTLRDKERRVKESNLYVLSDAGIQSQGLTIQLQLSNN